MADWYPFFVLGVGIAIVIGMIIGARLNAFLALITAAVVVSLMAPGEFAEKIARVAGAFGGTAGGVGIVIALAAVIGKCLMDSGAADRIVRAFLNALGEKRSSLALAGSGFVLSIPVFFDTVFYLLVPLARSLFRRTRKHYLKYVLAISAGAAITHSLVPPTPGPLLMAELLGVGLGTMIGVGVLIGLPATVVGLLYGSWLDKRMPIEMRPLTATHEPDPEADRAAEKSLEELPGLLVSLLPILLPVALIGMNTALETRANGEHAALISEGEITDWAVLKDRTAAAEQGAIQVLSGFLPDSDDPDELRQGFNKALGDRTAFPTGKDLTRKNLAIVEHENRLLLEASLPEEFLARHQWNTPKRNAANISKMYGNANFALLISAAIAVLLFIKQCRPSRSELSKTLEEALMSGGLIILITSAGGAFGAMLKAAEIGPAIERLFPAESGAGAGLLVLGFGIAAMLKIAQGSTTVAVITASSMVAAMIEGATLPFNPVYIATAIGGGGLVGSWMNDSGFWIFSKMGGITEAEALKSWTPLLCLLGTTAFLMSLLLSYLLPLA